MQRAKSMYMHVEISSFLQIHPTKIITHYDDEQGFTLHLASHIESITKRNFFIHDKQKVPFMRIMNPESINNYMY